MLEGGARVGNRAQGVVVENPKAAMSTFYVDTAGAGSRRVVTVRGEADLAHAERFWTSLENELLPGATVVADCSGVTFIDSQGLQVLLRVLYAAADIGAAFVLAAPSPRLVSVLELAGVRRLFDIVIDDACPSARAVSPAP